MRLTVNYLVCNGCSFLISQCHSEGYLLHISATREMFSDLAINASVILHYTAPPQSLLAGTHGIIETIPCGSEQDSGPFLKSPDALAAIAEA